MIYICAWLFCFGMLLCTVLFPRHARWYSTLAVCVVGAVAVFRGATGTDTVAYEQLSALVRSGGIFAVGIEPLFAALLKTLQQTGLPDIGVVRLVSGLFVVLLLIYTWRSVPNEQYLLLSAILPVFFYEYAMNALRIGLASILFLLVMQHLSRRRKLELSSLVLTMVACATHYTAILYPVFCATVLRRWSLRFLLGCVALFVLAAGVAFLVHPSYLVSRLQAYSAFPAPSRFSGLSSVIQVMLVSTAIWYSSLSRDLKLRLVATALALVVCFMGVVQFSYAGLRLLELVVFILPVAMVFAHELEGKPMNVLARVGLLVFGLVSVVFIFRRFLVESPDSVAPFLPYRLIFS